MRSETTESSDMPTAARRRWSWLTAFQNQHSYASGRMGRLARLTGVLYPDEIFSTKRNKQHFRLAHPNLIEGLKLYSLQSDLRVDVSRTPALPGLKIKRVSLRAQRDNS